MDRDAVREDGTRGDGGLKSEGALMFLRMSVAAAFLALVGSAGASPVPIHPNFCAGALCTSAGPVLHQLKWVKAVAMAQYTIGSRSGKYVFEYSNVGKVSIILDDTKPCRSPQRIFSIKRDAPNAASTTTCGFGPTDEAGGITISIVFESAGARELPELVDGLGTLWIATIRADHALSDKAAQITVGPAIESPGRVAVE
jgi:hypothetical protein